MAYFTAVLARSGRAWRARDVEVDDARTLDDLTESLRGTAVDGEPVLAFIEHEDEWFALVRVDGDEEPRLFVSDLAAATRSRYGEVLASAADVDVEESDEESDEEPEPVAAAVRVWAGEPDLLEDLGVTGRTLRKLVEENGDDPGLVLGEVGETVGFTEMLETLR